MRFLGVVKVVLNLVPHIREVPTPDVQRWAKEFIDFVHSKYPQITQEIREKKELSNDLKGRINKSLVEFNGLFQPTPAKT